MTQHGAAACDMPPPSELSCTEGQFLALDAATLPPNTVTRITCAEGSARGHRGYLKRSEVLLLLAAHTQWKGCSHCARLDSVLQRPRGKLCLACADRVLTASHARAARAAMQPVHDEWAESLKAGERIRKAHDHAIATGMVLTYANQVRQHQPPTMWDWVKCRVLGMPMPQPPAPAQLPSGYGMPPAAVPSAQGNQQHVGQPGSAAPSAQGNVGQPLAAGNHGAPAR